MENFYKPQINIYLDKDVPNVVNLMGKEKLKIS